MALINNIDVTPGSGKSVKTHDDGAGKQIQITKPGSSDQELLAGTKVDFNASGDNQIGPAGVALKTVRLYRGFLVFKDPTTVVFKDAAGGVALTGAIDVQAGGQISFDYDGEAWLNSAVAGALTINLSVAVQVSGRVYTTQV